MITPDKEYWTRRSEDTLIAGEKSALQYEKDLKAAYEGSLREIKKEISLFYTKYADENGLSLTGARNRLKPDEKLDFNKQAKLYLDQVEKLGDKAFTGEYEKELKQLSGKAYVSRLEELRTNIRHNVEILAVGHNAGLGQTLEEAYEDGFFKTAFHVENAAKQLGTEISFTTPGGDQLEKAVHERWLGANYSDRIWADKNKLTKELDAFLSKEFVRGKGAAEMAQEFAGKMGTSFSNASRLLRTEINYISNKATMDAYAETGMTKKYEILATLDNRTSDICKELDENVFEVKDAKPGINMPPFHPYCRSTTIPWFEEDEFDTPEDRVARDKDGAGKTIRLGESLNFFDWVEKYGSEAYKARVKKDAYKYTEIGDPSVPEVLPIVKAELIPDKVTTPESDSDYERISDPLESKGINIDDLDEIYGETPGGFLHEIHEWKDEEAKAEAWAAILAIQDGADGMFWLDESSGKLKGVVSFANNDHSLEIDRFAMIDISGETKMDISRQMLFDIAEYAKNKDSILMLPSTPAMNAIYAYANLDLSSSRVGEFYALYGADVDRLYYKMQFKRVYKDPIEVAPDDFEELTEMIDYAARGITYEEAEGRFDRFELMIEEEIESWDPEAKHQAETAMELMDGGEDGRFWFDAKGNLSGIATFGEQSTLSTDGTFHYRFQVNFMASAGIEKGMGRQIMMEMIEEAKKRDLPLNFVTEVDKASRFFDHIGFEEFKKALPGGYDGYDIPLDMLDKMMIKLRTITPDFDTPEVITTIPELIDYEAQSKTFDEAAEYGEMSYDQAMEDSASWDLSAKVQLQSAIDMINEAEYESKLWIRYGELAGFAAYNEKMILVDGAPKTVLEINYMAAGHFDDADLQRQILMEMIEEAKKRGLSLVFDTNNDKMKSYYDQAGFGDYKTETRGAYADYIIPVDMLDKTMIDLRTITPEVIPEVIAEVTTPYDRIGLSMSEAEDVWGMDMWSMKGEVEEWTGYNKSIAESALEMIELNGSIGRSFLTEDGSLAGIASYRVTKKTLKDKELEVLDMEYLATNGSVKGIGKQAVMEMMMEAKKVGVPLYISTEDDDARSFYDHLGFKDLKTGMGIVDSWQHYLIPLDQIDDLITKMTSKEVKTPKILEVKTPEVKTPEVIREPEYSVNRAIKKTAHQLEFAGDFLGVSPDDFLNYDESELDFDTPEYRFVKAIQESGDKYKINELDSMGQQNHLQTFFAFKEGRDIKSYMELIIDGIDDRNLDLNPKVSGKPVYLSNMIALDSGKGLGKAMMFKATEIAVDKKEGLAWQSGNIQSTEYYKRLGFDKYIVVPETKDVAAYYFVPADKIKEVQDRLERGKIKKTKSKLITGSGEDEKKLIPYKKTSLSLDDADTKYGKDLIRMEDEVVDWMGYREDEGSAALKRISRGSGAKVFVDEKGLLTGIVAFKEGEGAVSGKKHKVLILEDLATSPTSRGVGKQAVLEMLKEAKEKRLPLYIPTTGEDSPKFFDHMGLKKYRSEMMAGSTYYQHYMVPVEDIEDIMKELLTVATPKAIKAKAARILAEKAAQPGYTGPLPISLDNFKIHEQSWYESQVLSNVTEEKAKEIDAALKVIIDNNDFAMRVPDLDVLKLIVDSQFKSQFETNTSRGSLNTQARKRASEQLFGLDIGKMKSTDYEKYGYLASKNPEEDMEYDNGADHYGSVNVVFKKSRVENRTTFTVDDSLNAGYNYRTTATPVTNPRASGVDTQTLQRRGAVGDLLDGIKKYPNNPVKAADHGQISYFELQYHGKLTVDDIESVSFRKYGMSVDDENLVKDLKKRGIKVNIIGK